MNSLYDDEDKALDSEEEFAEADESIMNLLSDTNQDARRRLENLLEEKRLHDELDDFIDF